MEPIFDPVYWKRRLESARELHHSIFKCPLDRWQRIEEKHRQILARTIAPCDKVLDVGCGYGRLLSLMPDNWRGAYIGVDISPDFIAMAKEQWQVGKPYFVCGDIRHWDRSWGLREDIKMDWAVMISIRPMVRRNLDDDVWNECLTEIRKVAKRLLYLEYDENDEGSVE